MPHSFSSLVDAVEALASGENLSNLQATYLLRTTVAFGILLQGLACWNADLSGDQGEQGNFWEPLHYILYGSGVQNFEWSHEYAIRAPIILYPLALMALPFRLLPLTKLQVLLGLRFGLGVAGCGTVYSLMSAAKQHFGGGAAVIGLALALFNHSISLSIGRIGIDSFTLVFHNIAITLWMRKKSFHLIWLCAFVFYLRLSFGIPAIVMGLHVLLHQRPAAHTFMQWFSSLFSHAIAAIIVVGIVTAGCDSWWFGRPTLSSLNFFHFNIMHSGANNFGTMTLYFFVDKLLLDNNLIVSVLGFAGIVFSSRRFASFPSIALLSALCLFGHKEYRFLFPIFPVLALYAGVLLDRIRRAHYKLPDTEERETQASEGENETEILETGEPSSVRHRRPGSTPGPTAAPSGDSTAHQTDLKLSRIVSWRAVVVLCVLSLHAWSGVSIAALQAYAYQPHATFTRNAHRLARSLNVRGQGLQCVCSLAWCSWYAPQECSKLWVTNPLEEFFPGYNDVTYRRFEDPAVSARLHLAPHNASAPLWKDHYQGAKTNYELVEAQRIQRLHSIGVHAPQHTLGNIDLVLFMEETQSAHDRFKSAYISALGTEAGKAGIAHQYAELMLGPALRAQGFQIALSSSGTPLPGVFDFEPIARLTGLWVLPAFRPKTCLMFSVWTRQGSG